MPTMNAQNFLTDTSGTARGLAAKVFESQVLMAYRRTTLFHDMQSQFIKIRPLVGVGSSVDFPLIGSDPDAEQHTPGDQLLGQSQAFDKVNIAIDDFVVGDRFISGDDKTLSHFDIISEYAASIGRQLANNVDDKIVRMLIKAARTSASTGFHSGGNTVTRQGGSTTIADAYPESTTGASNLITDIRTLARQMDQDEVPEAGRKLVVSAYGRSVLMYDSTNHIFSRDFQAGTNEILNRKIGRVEGFDLYVSNNSIPSTNITNSGPRGNTTKYDVDCRYSTGSAAAGTGQPIALAFTGVSEGNAALGMTVAERMMTWIDYQPDRGGTFMMARNFLGVDKLCVWCAGAIQGAYAA